MGQIPGTAAVTARQEAALSAVVDKAHTAVTALASRKDKGVVSALAEVIHSGGPSSVRAHAVWALSRHETPQARKALHAATKRKTPEVSDRAKTLYRLSDK